MNWLLIGEVVGLIIFVAFGVLGMGWLRILKETNTLLKEQNVELKADNKMWQGKHEENVKSIAKLQGEVDGIKNVPLTEISIHMKKQTEINERLLNFMQNNLATA